MASKTTTKKLSATRQLLNKFDALALREQKLLMFAIPLSILLLVFFGVVEADIKKANKLQSNANNLQMQLSLNEETSAQLMQQANEDPDILVKQQISGLKQRLEQLNNDFAGEMAQLVSPQAMPILLEELLDKASDLQLLEMQSKEPQILAVNSNENELSNTQPIYRHTLNIKFEGDFFATRKFLAEAEQLGWKIYWQGLTYTVLEHPNAVTELSLFTLSTSEAFIGVN